MRRMNLFLASWHIIFLMLGTVIGLYICYIIFPSGKGGSLIVICPLIWEIIWNIALW